MQTLVGLSIIGTAFALASAPLPAVANVQIGDFAGYVASPSKAPTKASATFTVPTLNCKHVTSPEFIGATVTVQGGPATLGAVVIISCVNKASSFKAAWFLQGGPHFGGGGQFTMTISAGDSITESVSSTSSGSNVTIDDSTSKTTGTTKKSGIPGVDATSSTVGLICPPQVRSCATIPKFGTVAFSNATVNGKSIGSATPDEFQLDHITTSALGSDGESFSETYS